MGDHKHSPKKPKKLKLRDLASSDEQRSYVAWFERYLGQLERTFELRAASITTLWSVTIIAGAGVPLVAALDWPDWVAPVLGFLVVVAQAAQRVVARTAVGTAEVDALRRALRTERRLILAAHEPYDNPGTRFNKFVERVESKVKAYDAACVSYHQAMFATEGTGS